MKKVVVFGLAANPPHCGHRAIAEELAKHRDEVWLSPCYSHMHHKEMADPADRLRMCELAVAGLQGVKVCPMEIEQSLSIPTYDFLHKLRDIYPDIEFSFAIGQDNADAIDKWKSHEKLIAEFPFIVIPRNGYSTEETPAGQRWYVQEPHLFLKDFKTYNISSTLIRKSPKVMQDALRQDVYKYIKKNHLYEVHN